MPLETYTGRDPKQLLSRARTQLGADAVILELRRGGGGFELVAADAELAERLAPRGTPAPLAPSPSHPELATHGARRIALVGPTGAGKTTTIAKLLRHRDGVGARAGVLGLDTHRVGAVESLEALARPVRARVAVAHEPADLERALRALRGCRTVLVDTAGRGPAREDDTRLTWEMLRALRPAEVHLTVPAGLHPTRVRRLILEYRPLGITHVLVTKLDEYPEESQWFELAAQFRIAMRWVTNGQDLSRDLGLASAWKIPGSSIAPSSVGPSVGPSGPNVAPDVAPAEAPARAWIRTPTYASLRGARSSAGTRRELEGRRA
jgi:flagellar biosynthesis protein FlhF